MAPRRVAAMCREVFSGTGVEVYGSDAAWQELRAQVGHFEAAHRPSLARGHVQARLAGSGMGGSGTLTIHKT